MVVLASLAAFVSWFLMPGESMILLAYMFMREANLHKSVSTMSILKSKLWLGSQIPVTDKLRPY